MRILIRAVFIFTVVGLGKPSPSWSQVDIQVRLSPIIGFITPMGRLYDREAPGTADWTVNRSFTDLGVFPVIGISLEAGDSRLGFRVKARFSRSVRLEADFTGMELYVCPPDAYCLAWYPPPERHQWRLDASVSEFGIDLSLPTRLEIFGVEPYVAGGLGIRHYDFERPDQSEWLGFAPPGDGREWSVRVGGGVEFGLLGRPFSLSVMDTMSDYWGDLRHHLIWELGVPLFSSVPFSG